jgi:sigma-E factor negative regulatory protein RseC
MATEVGIVTEISESNMALVTTQRSGSCDSCGAKSMCHSLGGGKEAQVNAINSANARVGDRIVISFKTTSLMRAMFLLYAFPIICLLIGAIIGHNFAPVFQINSSALSAITGFLFFFMALCFVKSRAERLAGKDAYQPKIIRILERGYAEKKQEMVS